MTIKFQIKALEKSEFNALIKSTDTGLENKHAKWVTVDSTPGYPCRVSLVDANIGERVLAVSFTHNNVNSPYRASGAIFVREFSETVNLKINEVPTMLRHRLLSIRAYNSKKIMIGAEVLQGTELELSIQRQFQNSEVEFLHIHNANPGCFNCSVFRA